MPLLRDEPKTLYLYEVMTKDNPNHDWIGTVIQTEKDDLDPEHYKFIATQRYAFVGNMQEELDRQQNRNNMLHFANTIGQARQRVIYRDVIRYRKPVSLYRRIKRRILIYFRGKQDDKYFDKLFNNNQ